MEYQVVEDYINNIYEVYNKNVCRKIIKFSKCYVFFQYPETYTILDDFYIQDFRYKCRYTIQNEVIWKPQLHKERKENFIQRMKEHTWLKPLTMEEIKKLSYLSLRP